MLGRFCHGRECKLGWGYNESLDLLIPVEDHISTVISEVKNESFYEANSISSDDILYSEFISLLLELNFRKKLDFRIIFDNDEYWEVEFYLCRRTEEFKKSLNYPSNCSHYVSKIYYGTEFRVLFPKKEFPTKDRFEITNLFEKRNFKEKQKTVQCKVLINYDEIKEMNLEGFIKLITESNKQDSQDIPIRFYCRKLTQEVPEISINNEQIFNSFLSNLYCVYRKIEMIIEKVQHLDVLPDLPSEASSSTKIIYNLDKTKEGCKSVNKNDFLQMYPVLKKLFFRYLDYIRYSMNHESDMDEGDHIPGSCEEIKSWLLKLNSWSPVEVNEKLNNRVDSSIKISQGFKRVIQELEETSKFKDLRTINNGGAAEPHIEEITPVLIRVGVGKDAIHHYPKQGAEDSRKYLCAKCGDFVEIKTNSAEEKCLFCSCGSRRYDSDLPLCDYIKSRRLSVYDSLPELYDESQQF